MKKYNKEILAETSVMLDAETVEVYCLDGGDYYDIHTVSDNFKDEELNTLHLQEPKEAISLEAVTDKVYLTCMGLEFLLWQKFYGYKNKLHTFSCECVDRDEL